MTSITDPSRRPLLVFGDDGEEPADIAWRWIVNQAWPDWYIDVLTADTDGMEIQWGAPPAVQPWSPTWPRAETIEGAADVRFLKVATDPRAMMTELEVVDLLVLGLRTHSLLEGMVTGSTTEWLLYHPPAPMVVASSSDPVREVTVCTDGSEHAMCAIRTFLRLPLSRSTRVTVLAVEDGRADAQKGASQGVDALDGEVDEVEVVIEEGKATPTILDHLERTRPQLVVLGTKGLTGWKRLRLGSTASAVVRSAPCSSLVCSMD
ncbi:MAG TPA: universal stress protein [Acidimicrobiia bacterium]|nr:universal stress protein [Acidimicrobiia bacterium]